MQPDTPDREQLAKDLATAFSQAATGVENSTGDVFVGRMRLDTFIEEHFGPDWQEETEEFEEVEGFLEYVTGEKPEKLVEWGTGGSAPMAWNC